MQSTMLPFLAPSLLPGGVDANPPSVGGILQLLHGVRKTILRGVSGDGRNSQRGKCAICLLPNLAEQG